MSRNFFNNQNNTPINSDYDSHKEVKKKDIFLKIIGFAIVVLTTIFFLNTTGIMSSKNNHKPLLYLNGNKTINLAVGDNFIDPGVRAIDDTDGIISDDVEKIGTVNTSKEGKYVIKYRVKNKAGKETEIERTIVVQSKSKPSILFEPSGGNFNNNGCRVKVTVTAPENRTIVTAKYLWSKSNAEPTISSFVNNFRDTINSPAGVSGTYYLWVYVVDSTGQYKIFNSNTFTISDAKIPGDKNAPVVAFLPDGNLNGAKDHFTKVFVTDESDIRILKYIWSKNATGLEIKDIIYDLKNQDTIVTPNGAENGDYYLWVYVKDIFGNETISRSSFFRITTEVSPVAAKSIALTKTTVALNVSDTLNLTYTILPSNTTNKSVTWTSSNTNVATVDSFGLVTAKSAGTATITVTSKDNASVKATCIATVKKPNNTYKKKAIFFGDSITYGKGNMVTINGKNVGYSWANYIGDNYDLDSITNSGRSGWLISNNLDRFITSVVTSYKGTNYDYIILHGGVNDIRNNIKLGTYNSSNFSGEYDDTTFIGGLETYLYTVINQWPGSMIGYIINYQAPNSPYLTYSFSEPYYAAMRNVLEKWHIKYIDLFDGVASNGQTYSKLLKVSESTYLPDALHLNGEGYKVISPYIYEFMNTLEKCNKISTGRCS